MRRNGALFWGALLIIVGGLLLLQNLGVISVNVAGLIGPLLMIMLGVWVLWGVFGGGRPSEAQQLTVPLEGASEAEVRVNFGAGRLQMGVGAGLDEVISGTFRGGVEHKVKRTGNTLMLQLDAPDLEWRVPWGGGQHSERDWQVRLNGGLPLALDLRMGASDTRLDLSDARIMELTIKTGASATDVTLPANAGLTRVKIEAGAASVILRVPPGVAARLNMVAGLGSVQVDTARFPRQGGYYQSPDFDSAPNKIEVEAKTGAGSIEVK